MFELSGLSGWLIVIAFVGTLLNYIVKFINKRFGKKINASSTGKKIMKALMVIFVRNHKYFGFAASAFLLVHFIIQFNKYGFVVSGVITGILLILSAVIGMYGTVKKKPRKGLWFITHRILAVLMIIGVVVHIINPFGLNNLGKEKSSLEVSEDVDVSQLPTFTLEELSTYNGLDGNKAYVAYKGFVYDVTNVPAWKEGMHNGQVAGTDLTEEIGKAPHGDGIFERLEIIGKIG